MVAHKEKVSSQAIVGLINWREEVSQHLGIYLSAPQLDGVYQLWQAGLVQLWAVVLDDAHVGTIVTRMETMLDDTRQLVLAHCGGEWYAHMDVLSPFFDEVARQNNCGALRLDAGRPALARIFRRKWNFNPYETSVIREVSA